MYSRISWHKHVSCAFSRLPFSLLNRRAGAPTRAIHALPSTFFSLLSTVEAHCKVSTHYLLLSSPFSLLSCPLVSISGSIIIPFVYFVFFVVFPPSLLLLRGRVAEPPRGRAQARHPRTTFSFLLPTPYFRVHSCPFVVLSFFSCVSCVSWFDPFVPIRALSWFNNLAWLRENWENIVNPWEL